DVFLTNQYFPNTSLPGGNIQVGGINVSILAERNGSNSGSVTIDSRGRIILNGSINTVTSPSPDLQTLITSNGGAATLLAQNNITLNGDILSYVGGRDNPYIRGNGGNISLSSTAGTINTRNSQLDAGTIDGNGGAIAISAAGDIITGTLRSRSDQNGTGGAIRLTSTSGAIDTSAGTLDTVSAGNGGAIALSAATNITTADLNSRSTSGSGGAIDLRAASTITTGNIDASGELKGGNISLTSTDGTLTTGILNAAGGNTGGNVTLSALSDIATGEITTFISGFNGNSGSISITSTSGNISNQGALLTASGSGNGGNVTFNAAGNIYTRNINASSLSTSGGIGGKIKLTAETGNIIISTDTPTNITKIATNNNDILLNSPVTLAGNVSFTNSGTSKIIFNNTINGNQNLTLNTNGGTVEFNNVIGGLIPLNNLTVFGDITTTNSAGIDIRAVNNITTNNITSPGGIALSSSSGQIKTDILNSSSSGNSGNIKLDARGNIIVNQINAQSLGMGTGGNVDITTGSFFQATDSSPDQNGVDASISVAGGEQGGTIIIRHAGGGVTPFVVGNAVTNGTAGAITRGNSQSEQTISPTQEYFFTYKQDADRLQIISVPGVPRLPTPIPVPEPITPLELGGNPVESLANLVGDTLNAETLIYRNPNSGDYSFDWNFPKNQISLNVPSPDDIVYENERFKQQEFEKYFGETLVNEPATAENLRETLKTIESQTGEKAAVVYVRSLPDQLELVLVSSESPPIRRTVPAADSKTLCTEVSKFRQAVNDYTSKSYRPIAQKLYQWMIAPLEANLKASQINTLIFSNDACLRSLPLAALHDGRQFLIEKYSIASIPSVSLTDTSYQSLKDSQVLAMGASEFSNPNQNPLPAVPVELSTIVEKLWQGESFLNELFTLDNLRSRRRQRRFEIVHLATHADFPSQGQKGAYIQLWDGKLGLDELRRVKWYAPPMVQLLVLSACNTAVGNKDSEMGFAGLAVQAGVKSVLASLWQVNDVGTLALMTEFYHQMSKEGVTIKAEALRQAQIAMLHGQVRIKSGQLVGIGTKVTLPPGLENRKDQNLSHPYYWAGFTVIGSPW
ncbi:MAG TPA: CHAT domain-containing protein, partial [Chroococcales cyanobacterium]